MVYKVYVINYTNRLILKKSINNFSNTHEMVGALNCYFAKTSRDGNGLTQNLRIGALFLVLKVCKSN